MEKNDDFCAIENYFIIGDLRTAALVSSQGSIDWLCLPHFDSPSIFSKLLDPRAGCLAIEMPDYKVESRYVEDTAIVEFELSSEENQFSVKDFMVPHATKTDIKQQLVRLISGSRGKANVKFRFQPMPGFATKAPSVIQHKNKLVMAMGNGTVILHLPAQTTVDEKGGVYLITIPVKARQSKRLVLEYIPKGHKPTSIPADPEEETADFWRAWVKKGDFFDFCRDYLVRSAITLKLMQFYPTGALVAAPTTSLPEEIGGVRNWDYRYVWIRDATFALYSFYVLGYDEEAEHFFNFIEQVTEKCAEEEFDVSLMYTIWGEPIPEEHNLTDLSGYKNSSPVRVGNDASRQFQLDVYGSLIDAFYFASKHRLADSHKQKWRKIIMQLVRKIDKEWQKPDHGIWEVRVGTKHYTYSKVMAWVGADRANRLKNTLELTDEDTKVCAKLAESIRDWVWQNCYKKEGQVLTQYPNTESVDATNLLFVLLQFLDKHESVTKKIIDNTAKELNYKEVFVYRYLKNDGLPGEEGAFVLCSFWLISALAILEDVEPAIKLFKQVEKYMKPHGLLSEEIDPGTGSYLGNYPQAFSHMGYIMSAHYLHKYAGRKSLKL